MDDNKHAIYLVRVASRRIKSATEIIWVYVTVREKSNFFLTIGSITCVFYIESVISEYILTGLIVHHVPVAVDYRRHHTRHLDLYLKQKDNDASIITKVKIIYKLMRDVEI